MKERRRDPRIKQENKVVLIPVAAGGALGPARTYYSLTRDISVGGIRIMTDAPLAVDSRVQLEISLTKSRRRIQAVARVRWVKELFGKEVYDVGLEFVEIAPDAELALIDHVYGRAETKT